MHFLSGSVRRTGFPEQAVGAISAIIAADRRSAKS